MPTGFRKKKSPKSALTGSLSVNELEQVKQVSKKKHGTAANTTASYNGYIQRGKLWLAELIAGSSDNNTFECPRGSLESGNSTTWKWTPLDLVHAFDPTPTRASPWALASFITFKCFKENLGASTADGIQAAFKKYWDNVDTEGIYRGNWKWDGERGCGTGNPASSVDVMDTVHAVKKKHGAENQRSHSTAMSLNMLQQIYDWSLRSLPLRPILPDILSLTPESRLLLHKHLGWRVFSSFSWTLWTRNFETLQIQRHHLIFGCTTDDAFQLPHWKVSLELRKNWQNKLGKEQELRGHLYEIYPRPELPSADLDFHMRTWLSYLEHAYGRALVPTDWIFPSIGSNGIIQQHMPMSHDIIQKWIDEFTKGAGIDASEVRLTTHCFRRGGAQYQFMYAPVGKRWTLATIRWWGGWAEGEHRDTLIRYLLDELHYYEDGHGNALRPIPTENHLSFMGEHREIQPVTAADMKTIFTSIEGIITTRITSAITNVLREDGRFSDRLNTLQTRIPSNSADSPLCITRRGEHNPSYPSYPSTIHTTPDGHVITSPLPATINIPAGLYLPNLTQGIKTEERWKVFVKQWDFGDKHCIALKNWEASWIKHPDFANKYFQRKSVALEFERCGRDEGLFLERWPEAKKGITALLTALRQGRMASGEAKPRQRKPSKNVTTSSNSYSMVIVLTSIDRHMKLKSYSKKTLASYTQN